MRSLNSYKDNYIELIAEAFGLVDKLSELACELVKSVIAKIWGQVQTEFGSRVLSEVRPRAFLGLFVGFLMALVIYPSTFIVCSIIMLLTIMAGLVGALGFPIAAFDDLINGECCDVKSAFAGSSAAIHRHLGGCCKTADEDSDDDSEDDYNEQRQLPNYWHNYSSEYNHSLASNREFKR